VADRFFAAGVSVQAAQAGFAVQEDDEIFPCAFDIFHDGYCDGHIS
jgi:hypothetical protein